MPKRYDGEIALAIRGRPAKERAEIKAREIVRAVKRQVRIASEVVTSYQPNDGPLAAWKVSVLSLEADAERLVMFLRVLSPLGIEFPFSNPYIVFNPPIMVPSGEKTTIVEDGVESEIDVMEENPVLALETIVLQIVESAIARDIQLWRP